MKFYTLSKAVRLFVLGGVLLGIGMTGPLAFACRVIIPPDSSWSCTCDADCACVCIQTG